ncbi:endocuticle structural protein SgAbd-6-like [Bradysia coprophila]|uniref:endocuticle structural protein SgAbd-6-like n=1 Tax=Bradysia coprophila TaxID=38358 RepID=UPI00187D7FAE|nr:endocuticle structural protein SgAbd-6-like [Bradysia coprophila]
MKWIIVLAVFVAVVTCAPADVEVLRYENDNIGIDGYKFAYEQSDGVSRSEEAVLKNAGTEQEAIEVRGTISWTAPDGEVYTLNFVADENGYRPEGAHLPHL